ncbi:MAG: phosphoadenosine phosphosulfate reductase family protein [Sphaerochaeta sp.]|jgi:phosphoadenosine phosphosulfate reductase|nr:phosphoadenosine phosphosulfate reductase family protein [Sphaerochaeta sp.]
MNDVCSACGQNTQEEIPHICFWCSECNSPIIVVKAGINSLECPYCHTITKQHYEDMRPVFPEERLLLEYLLGYKPLTLAKSSIWSVNNKYLVDGEIVKLSSDIFTSLDVHHIIQFLALYDEVNRKESYPLFSALIDKFCVINDKWLKSITSEALSWIHSVLLDPKYTGINVMVSFSGGKDSTVVSDLVTRAFGTPKVLHMFGDTTLEFPLTYEYIQKFRDTHPYTPLRAIRNNDQKFHEVCKDIGPPARMMRWCCSMFKTGPITRKINQICSDTSSVSLGNASRILTFYGIRKNESVSRSKYERIDGSNEVVKIQKQVVGSPIFFWKDIDIWLYILANQILFNDAYRLGYDRVGCWCCPNNSQRAQFLSRIYMPKESENWRNILLDFANKVGKPDPEVYVDEGWWKARQGGEGLIAASDVEIKYSNCTTEDNARVFQLTREINDEFFSLCIPFGLIKQGRASLEEKLVFDTKSTMPIISIIPFSQTEFLYSVKIRIMNVKNAEDLFRQVSYQIRKFNACRKCLKCESICKFGAISVSIENGYQIDSKKCKHCKLCVNQKYLSDGCLMGKYLRVRGGYNETKV